MSDSLLAALRNGSCTVVKSGSSPKVHDQDNGAIVTFSMCASQKRRLELTKLCPIINDRLVFFLSKRAGGGGAAVSKGATRL